MRIAGILAAIAFGLLTAPSAFAATRTVVPDITALRAGPAGGPNFTVTCYDSAAAVCAGGGDFDQNGTCITDNGATQIKDGGGNCYYRKNFGINGTVDARQCGVRGDGTTVDTTALQTCINLASALPSSGTMYPVVNTGGGQVVVNGNIQLKQDVWLDCGATTGGSRTSDDYTLASGIAGVIAMPGTNSILSADNSGIRNCIVERNSGTSPPTTALPTTLRQSLTEASNFSGVAIQNTSETFQVQNVLVLGFDSCYAMGSGASPGSTRAIVDHFGCDGNQFRVENSSANTQFDDISIIPYLTRSNGKASSNVWTIDRMINSSGSYLVTAEIEPEASSGSYCSSPFTPPQCITLVSGDRVWISTPGIVGAQSGGGRWNISSPAIVNSGTAGCVVIHCQTFILTSSTTSPTTATLSWPDGATKLTGFSAGALAHVAVGQAVTGTCIPANTYVGLVWASQGIITLVQSDLTTPMVLPCVGSSFSVSFTDTSYAGGGEVTMSAVMRTYSVANEQGGIYIKGGAGATFNNCHVFTHDVAIRIYGGGLSRFVNCSVGLDDHLPDDTLVGLLCDGPHMDPDDDCEDFDWVNGQLAQHYPHALVVDTLAPKANRIANATMGPGTAPQADIMFEVIRGRLTLASVSATVTGNAFISNDAVVKMSSLDAPLVNLYLEGSAALSQTDGCGAIFSKPVPFTCSPASIVPPPQGRLTLMAQGTNPPSNAVMTADVSGATSVYYVPYVGQQLPIYNLDIGALAPVNMGSSGLTLPLVASKQLANTLHDIFAETLRGSLELCAGSAWDLATPGASKRNNTGATDNTTEITRVNGVWVNSMRIDHCQYGTSSGDHVECPAYACTYLGTMYMTAAGQTSQKFGPNSAARGAGNCLCLYNAYNRVPVVSQSLDSSATYTYGSTTWRAMNGLSPGPLAENSITVVDGLGEMAIAADLSDALKGVTGTNPSIPRIGLVLDSTSVTAPAFMAQNQTNSTIVVTSQLRNAPIIGLWYVQAMESASSSASSPSFGGPSEQQMSVHVSN